MKLKTSILFTAFVSSNAFAIQIPDCLQRVVNQVSVCKETIENELAYAEKIVNRNKNEIEKLHYGKTFSFPTTVKGQSAILALTETNGPVTQVILFKAEVGYGLFWQKKCQLSTVNLTTIPVGTEKDFLAKTFNCQQSKGI